MIQKIRNWFRSELPFIVGVPPFLWQVLFLYIPLAIVVVLSVIQTDVASIWSTLTVSHFVHMSDWVYLRVIGRSLFLAASTAIITLLLGYPMAYYIAFKSRRAYLWAYFLIIPFLTNFLFHAFAWTFILERQGVVNMVLQWLYIIDEPIHFLNTSFAVYVMMVYSYLPFMIFPIYTTLEKLHRQFLEVSYDLGASWWQTLWRIIMPLSVPGIQSGFFLVFIPAFGEFAIPELLGGDKTMYVGSVISHYVLDAWTQSKGAAFTLMSMTILLIVSMIVTRILRWAEGVRS